jgi:hypothetical protein
MQCSHIEEFRNILGHLQMRKPQNQLAHILVSRCLVYLMSDHSEQQFVILTSIWW